MQVQNSSKLGRLLNKKGTIRQEHGFIQSQPIHERPLYDAISKEVLGEKTKYQSSIDLNRDHPVSRIKNLRERSMDTSVPKESLSDKVGFSLLWPTSLGIDIGRAKEPSNQCSSSRTGNA